MIIKTALRNPRPTTRQDLDTVLPEMVKMRDAGHTFQEIADRYGWSMEMVRRRIRRERGQDVQDNIRSMSRARMVYQITQWLNEQPRAVTRQELLRQFPGMDSQQLSNLLYSGDRRIPSHLVIMAPRDDEDAMVFMDEDISDALRRAWSIAKEQDPSLRGMSHVLYESLRRHDDICASRVTSRVGWSAACAAAGIPPGKDSRPKDSYKSKWTDDQILEYVREYATEAREAAVKPTYAGFDRWIKGRDGAPSGSMIRVRMQRAGHRSWPSILSAAFSER